MADPFDLTLDPYSATPLYRQLADHVSQLIAAGSIQSGDRLPPTRDLASQLGLNRTTVSAAYSALEDAGLIRGHVGRGSFVAGRPAAAVASESAPATPRVGSNIEISFANSRPPADAFPVDTFRRVAREVIDSTEAAAILQLGSPLGYPPLRRHLLRIALDAGIARPNDDILITNGCQQALDLIARVFVMPRTPVAIEDPVYHGLLRVFARADAALLPVRLDNAGIDLKALEETLDRHNPKLLIVTPSFQNPTGATLGLDRRKRIVALAQRYGVMLVENDIYTDLRYRGSALPTLKELDESGNTVLLRSYSKVLFPGLRVGWIIAPRAVISRLSDTKQISDLHSDQLSQAVLLRFTESGELRKHLSTTHSAGERRLAAAVNACQSYLPSGSTFTKPDGGMNLWVELPPPLTADALLSRTQERGVDFMPGRNFSATGSHARGLRISFGGLPPDQITRGIQLLGECARRELAAASAASTYEPTTVLV